MKRLCLTLFAVSLLAACEPADDTLRLTMPACRPPDIAQGILFIGDTRFAPYQVQASAVTDSAGRPALSIRMDESGASKLEALTVANMGEVLPCGWTRKPSCLPECWNGSQAVKYSFPAISRWTS